MADDDAEESVRGLQGQEMVAVGVVDESATLLADGGTADKQQEDSPPGVVRGVDYNYPQKYRKNTISGCVPFLPCMKRAVGRLMVFQEVRCHTAVDVC